MCLRISPRNDSNFCLVGMEVLIVDTIRDRDILRRIVLKFGESFYSVRKNPDQGFLDIKS